MFPKGTPGQSDKLDGEGWLKSAWACSPIDPWADRFLYWLLSTLAPRVLATGEASR
jgi:hypothetical protein